MPIPRLGPFLVLALAGHLCLLTLLWPEAPRATQRLALRVLPPPAVAAAPEPPARPARPEPADAPAPSAVKPVRTAASPAPATKPATAPSAADTALPQPLRLPSASGRLDYILVQDQQTGRARFSWELEDGRYRLLLERELPGRALPGWQSLGHIEASGMAPERFTVQREGRDRQAVNFRRDQGLLSYSQSSATYSLPPGAQDRLSWWLQLPALVAASSARLRPGDAVRLPLAPITGAPREWIFSVEARSAEGLWLLAHQDPGERPLRTEVWLDARQQFLPVRMRQSLEGTPHWELIQAIQASNPSDP
ncbi:MAG: DUF3108 domain-containing protein [Burkholderiaceae bacterium]|nr:DUF3108 domain-containing protein [Roseateles sp.]MBV8471212.1 DUF3108 domain-containing protein [Burkholderiaceae bacterium]